MTKESIKLEALTRKIEENNKEIIKNSQVPAVLYGAHLKENITLKIDHNAMQKVFAKAGESTLIDLILDGKETNKKILIKDIQKDVVKDTLIHVDFFEVDMKKPIQAAVALNFIGECDLVKNMGGMLMKEMTEINVKCLPEDLVNHIDVDTSKIEKFGSPIAIKDIKIPEKMEIIHEENDVVAIVVEPRIEKEETTAEEEGEETTEAKEGDDASTDSAQDKKEDSKEGASSDASTGSAQGKKEEAKK